MPHKDPQAAAASKHAYYLAHKDAFLARSKARRERLQAEAREQKRAEAAIPKPVQPKMCKDCGADITDTYTSKWGMRCAACKAEYHRAYRKANAERIAEKKRLWKLANPEHVKAKDRAYAVANPDKRAKARARWDATNPGATAAAKAANHSARKKRVPTWLSDDDKWMLTQAYALAALRTKIFGFPWHVDHIIPLNGKVVSGLHVPYNVQVIPAVENLRKSNKLDGI